MLKKSSMTFPTTQSKNAVSGLLPFSRTYVLENGGTSMCRLAGCRKSEFFNSLLVVRQGNMDGFGALLLHDCGRAWPWGRMATPAAGQSHALDRLASYRSRHHRPAGPIAVLSLKQITGVIILALLTACVTTTTGRQPPEASDDEAAKINLQLGVS
jgi:hypothetical protein